MPLRFDATLKDLGRDAPRDVLTMFDRPPTLPVSLLNVDLSTVTTAADLVVGLGEPLQEVVHIDFQASASATKHADVLVYNALLHRHYQVPVHSIAVLLRPEAAHRNLNGGVRYAPRPDRGKMEFGYEIIPLWDHPAEEFLAGPLGTLPLALLGRLPGEQEVRQALILVLRRMVERLTKETTPDHGRKLMTSGLVLLGLRLPRNTIEPLLQGVGAMPFDLRESATYWVILDEGREEQVKKDILRIAQKRLGPADESVSAKLTAITGLDRLERIVDRILEATTWADLLDTP